MKYRYLPTEITIGDKIYPINKNGDYEIILDIFEVMKDKELTEQEKTFVCLNIFYDFNLPQTMDELNIAVSEMLKFINCGEVETKKENNKPRLMDWNIDFPWLAAPINRVLGYDIRSKKYVHWWTFVSAYMEIGECTFQTIVGIRNKKLKGQKLEKGEQEFYRENKDKINAVNGMNDEDNETLKNYLDEEW